MANADADGGFHERAAGSDGTDAGNELAKHGGEASMQVDLPPLLRGAMTAQSDELDIEDEMEHDEEREEEEEGEEGVWEMGMMTWTVRKSRKMVSMKRRCRTMTRV